ncbi:hypothetical protein ACTPOK_05315 [Streptomyces inhibens]
MRTFFLLGVHGGACAGAVTVIPVTFLIAEFIADMPADSHLPGIDA